MRCGYRVSNEPTAAPGLTPVEEVATKAAEKFENNAQRHATKERARFEESERGQELVGEEALTVVVRASATGTLGIVVKDENVNGETMRVFVAQISDDSVNSGCGLQVGDEIVAVDHVNVRGDFHASKRALAAAKVAPVLCDVVRPIG